jgi:hypothetical protein
LKTTLLFKLEDCFLPSAASTFLGDLQTEGQLSQEQVQKFHATALSFSETALSYLKKWTGKSFQDLKSYIYVTLNTTFSWADIERPSSLVIKTVLSVQLAKN